MSCVFACAVSALLYFYWALAASNFDTMLASYLLFYVASSVRAFMAGKTEIYSSCLANNLSRIASRVFY